VKLLKRNKKRREIIMKTLKITICIALFLVAIVSSIVLAAEKEETVVFARPEGFIILDTQNTNSTSNHIIDKLIYDRLIELQLDGSLVPGLAKSWELNEDETEITFHLREGVKFHNGEPFTSESVKFTFERLRDNPELVRASQFGSDQIEKVEIIDDYTCVLHMKQTYAPLCYTLAQGFNSMLPPKAYAELGDKLWDHPIGTGPFKFVEYLRDVSLIVDANTDYWQEGIPTVDKIIYKPIIESSTLIASLLTGDVDIVDMLHPDQVPILEMDSNITVLRGIVWDGWLYQFNMKNPILSDVRVRTAIDLATNRDRLIEVMGGGGPRWICSYPGMVGYTPELRADYDPEKARKLLKETGYTKEELTFSYKVPEGWYPKMSEIAVAIQSLMADVGITFEIQVLEGASFMDARHNADYDIFTTGAAYTDPVTVTIPRVVNDSDHSSYVNEELNQLLIIAASTLEVNKRQSLYEQAYKIMFEEKAPQLYFFQLEAIFAYKNRITGFPSVPINKVVNLRTIDTTDEPGPVK